MVTDYYIKLKNQNKKGVMKVAASIYWRLEVGVVVAVLLLAVGMCWMDMAACVDGYGHDADHHHRDGDDDGMVLPLRSDTMKLEISDHNIINKEGGRGRARYSYEWKVEHLFWSPDCVEKVVIGVNGEFPGPTLRGRAGDVLQIRVHNALPTQSLSIHWHGIKQVGTPWADGAASVSQCAVNPKESFIYTFVLDKAGTYSYYGLHGLQRSEGLYGMIIVDPAEGEKVPFEYDGEFNILVSDWWHKSADEQTLGLLSPPSRFRWVGEPQSLLINGRGRYECSLVPKSKSGTGDSKTCTPNHANCSIYTMAVERGKTYRLRIASVASLSSLNFLVEKHKLTVVEADGNYVDPVEVDDLNIYGGESYSVLLSTNQFPGRNYWMALNVRGREPMTPTGLAILNYKPVSPTKLPSTQPPLGPPWNNVAYSIAQSKLYTSRKGFGMRVPSIAQKRIMLLCTQNLVNNGNNIGWAMNNISLMLPSTPYLASMVYDIDDAYDVNPPPTTFPSGYDIRLRPKNPYATSSSSIYTIPFSHTIDIIIQNANTLFPNNSEIHPWHLHGHDFWIIGQGIGKFDPENDPKSYNLVNPPLRNTATLFPYSWVAIRFIANNPGVWLMHCMIDPHLIMGMGVVFAEGIEWINDVPSSTLGCGLTKDVMFTSFIN